VLDLRLPIGVIADQPLADISATMASGGRLASVPSCCATRTSLDRDEIAIPTQIDQPARSGVKRT
jgi:hypothetical protein